MRISTTDSLKGGAVISLMTLCLLVFGALWFYQERRLPAKAANLIMKNDS